MYYYIGDLVIQFPNPDYPKIKGILGRYKIGPVKHAQNVIFLKK